MDAFTGEFVKALVSPVASLIVESTVGRVRKAVAGTDKEQALERCLEAGIAALLTETSTAMTGDLALLEDIFRTFFSDQRVGREIAELLGGQSLDVVELEDLFTAAGYDAATLPGLDFERGIQAFQSAFLWAAQQEPLLQAIILTSQSLAQTSIQREQLA